MFFPISPGSAPSRSHPPRFPGGGLCGPARGVPGPPGSLPAPSLSFRPGFWPSRGRPRAAREPDSVPAGARHRRGAGGSRTPPPPRSRSLSDSEGGKPAPAPSQGLAGEDAAALAAGLPPGHRSPAADLRARTGGVRAQKPTPRSRGSLSPAPGPSVPPGNGAQRQAGLGWASGSPRRPASTPAAQPGFCYTALHRSSIYVYVFSDFTSLGVTLGFRCVSHVGIGIEGWRKKGRQENAFPFTTETAACDFPPRSSGSVLFRGLRTVASR